MTNITIIGNVVADPELRFTPNGVAVANFRIANTPRRFNRDTNQWEDGEALFLTCNAWKQLGENVANTLTKGMRVIVTGKLKARSYQTREGENRTVHEIDVDEVGPSIKYATAQVARNPREDAQATGQQVQQTAQQQAQGGFSQAQQNVQNVMGGQQATQDPWNAAPPQGGFGAAADEQNPPF